MENRAPGKIVAQNVAPDVSLLKSMFQAQQVWPDMRNPHFEVPVSDKIKAGARKSSVLIPIVDREQPTVLVTRRHPKIRFGGHICFPGGHLDGDHETHIEAALREAREEVALLPNEVEVLGSLGRYYSQAGYEITPVVGIVSPTMNPEPNPDEVDAIYEVPLATVLQVSAYSLTMHGTTRGHFSYRHNDIRIAGPTVSMLIGLFEAVSDHVHGV